MLLVLLVVVCLFSSGYSQTYPSSVLVPSNAITDVSFTCNVSSPEWRVNGTVLHFGNIPLGISPTMSEGMTVSKTYVLRYNGTSIQCRQHDGENWSSIPAAFIRVYGTNINLSSNFLCYMHVNHCFILQVLPQSQVICHQSQVVYWCSAGLLHGLLMEYS